MGSQGQILFWSYVFPSPKSGVSFKQVVFAYDGWEVIGFRPLKAGLVLNFDPEYGIYGDYMEFPSPKSGVSFKLVGVNKEIIRSTKEFPSPKSGVSFKLRKSF